MPDITQGRVPYHSLPEGRLLTRSILVMFSLSKVDHMIFMIATN